MDERTYTLRGHDFHIELVEHDCGWTANVYDDIDGDWDFDGATYATHSHALIAAIARINEVVNA